MTIIENCNTPVPETQQIELSQGNFQIGGPSDGVLKRRTNKLAKYFDAIYTYPPKIKIKWDGVDELKEDLFIEYNYGVLEHSFPFIDFLQDWSFNETPQEAIVQDYKISDYIDGYLDKLNTSNFYKNKTTAIKKSIANIPVFVVLNGQGEIPLGRPSNNLSQNAKAYTREVVYDFCGAFDSQIEKRQRLGLFFFNKAEAEIYLQSIAATDIDTTEQLGLSVHCVSLESAYSVMREYHPGVDFRFVPNMNELKTLLTKYVSQPDVIVEDEQQQLRFRRRTVNLFPQLGKLGKQISPISSFFTT